MSSIFLLNITLRFDSISCQNLLLVVILCPILRQDKPRAKITAIVLVMVRYFIFFRHHEFAVLYSPCHNCSGLGELGDSGSDLVHLVTCRRLGFLLTAGKPGGLIGSLEILLDRCAYVFLLESHNLLEVETAA